MASINNIQALENRKEGIIFKALGERIAATRSILNKALTMSGKDVETMLDGLMVSLLNNLPPEEKERFIKSGLLEERGRELFERSDMLHDALSQAEEDNEDAAEINSINEQSLEVTAEEIHNKRELETLIKGDTGQSIAFLKNIELLLNNLKLKHPPTPAIHSRPATRQSYPAPSPPPAPNRPAPV